MSGPFSAFARGPFAQDLPWVSAESKGASPSNTAAGNTAAINAALASGGLVTLTTPGTYLFDTAYATNAYGLWTVDDFTHLYIEAEVTIKNVSATAIPFIVNSNARSNRIGISSITADAAPPFSYYTNVVVNTSTAHGLTSAQVGKFIYIQGDSGDWYNGVHRITGITDVWSHQSWKYQDSLTISCSTLILSGFSAECERA